MQNISGVWRYWPLGPAEVHVYSVVPSQCVCTLVLALPLVQDQARPGLVGHCCIQMLLMDAKSVGSLWYSAKSSTAL